jgi:hypothetical protein
VVAVVIVLATSSGNASPGCTSTFACRITPNGVAGVEPDMTPQQVSERWGIPVRAPETILGSDSVAYAAICDGPVRGWARFYGTNGGPFYLTELHFISAAQMKSGIGIGSTRASVMDVYGKRVLRRKLWPHRTSNDLMLLGHPRTRGARPAVVFRFRGDRVDEIIFGSRNGIRASGDWKYEIQALPQC